MKQAEEYRQQAKECRELAKHALTRSERDQLLELAEIWERLASERMSSLPYQPDPAPAKPEKK
ncbi:MAG TPA: hypothetical protein VHN20_05835 [Beijerinckiaceae bacterium]|nr:hypothetical protein [Beijerinckiaceae bacterium]